MKKYLTLFIIILLLISLFGCKERNANNSTDSEAELEETNDANNNGYEIAFLTELNTINDAGYNQEIWESIKNYGADNNKSVNYLCSIDKDKVNAIDQVVKEWKTKVIVVYFDLWNEIIIENAELYPGVKFIIIDGNNEIKKDNVITICFDEVQAGFLVGYAIVKDGYKDLGYLGLKDNDNYGYGFCIGANYAAQALDIKDIKIRYQYVLNDEDSKDVMNDIASWYENGAEVIFCDKEEVLNSAIDAALLQEGRYLIGANIDQSDKSERVITSAMKSFKNATYQALTLAFNNEFNDEGNMMVLSAMDDAILLPEDYSMFKTFSKDDYLEIYELLKKDSSTLIDLQNVKNITDLKLERVVIESYE